MSHIVEKKLKRTNTKDEAGCTSNSYPDQNKIPRKLTCSPILSQLSHDDIDVVWDWHSPTSKPRPFKPKIKIHQSPKLLVKRHPSNEQISFFNKLEAELKTFTNKTSVHSKTNCEKTKTVLEVSSTHMKNLQDIFNDSMDEELIMCSQQVELQNNWDHNESKPNLEEACITSNEIENDSFDCILERITDEDLKLKSNNRNETNVPTEIHSIGDSPIKCSPEEIEQKRLQALAKLQAKKQEKIIEQNRQEALRRLEISRKRRLFQS